MKEAQDLLQGLKTTLDEASVEIEDMPDFDNKELVLDAVYTSFNEISYALSELS